MDSFDETKFRSVLSHYPTGVTLVTAMHQGDPVGLIIGSFTSVSLKPPLVGFLVDKKSSTWPRIAASGSFCVNILGHHQAEVCRLFARSSTDRFAAIGWRPERNGIPVLENVIGWIDCDIDRVDEAGDHWWVIGRVVQLEAAGEGSPLVFVRGGFGHPCVKPPPVGAEVDFELKKTRVRLAAAGTVAAAAGLSACGPVPAARRPVMSIVGRADNTTDGGRDDREPDRQPGSR